MGWQGGGRGGGGKGEQPFSFASLWEFCDGEELVTLSRISVLRVFQ